MTDIHVDPGSSFVTVTAIPPALTVIEVFAPDQYNDLGDGDYTLTAGHYAQGLTRDGQPPIDPALINEEHPDNRSQPDDVMSMQPDGSWQTRPKGANGPYERCKKTAAGAVYRPVVPGVARLVGVATEVPNQ